MTAKAGNIDHCVGGRGGDMAQEGLGSGGTTETVA